MREIVFRAYDKTMKRYKPFDGMHDTTHSDMEKRIVLLEETLREAMWIIEAEVEAYGQRKEQHRWWRLLRDMKELLGD